MHAEEIAEVLHITEAEARRLLALAPETMYQDPGYQALVRQLEPNHLHKTAPQARAVYMHSLDPVKEKYGLSDTIMSGYTLVNWVLGFLMAPDHLPDMLDRHAKLDRDTIAAVLPELVDILGDMEEGSLDWQQALVVFSLPLIAGS